MSTAHPAGWTGGLVVGGGTRTATATAHSMRLVMRVVVGVVLLASCAADGPDAEIEAAVDRDAAIAAAIDVRADGCGPRIGFGTGSVIGGGDIVTAAHVVAGSTEVVVIDVEGMTTSAAVVFFDPELDLALLHPAAPVGTPLPVRSREAQSEESGIVVLPRVVDGTVEIEVADVRVVRTVSIETTDIYRAVDVTRQGFEIEGSIDPGDSGAMVVLPGGGAGVVWARSNRTAMRAWAIDLPAELRTGTDAANSLVPNPPSPVDVGACTPS